MVWLVMAGCCMVVPAVAALANSPYYRHVQRSKQLASAGGGDAAATARPGRSEWPGSGWPANLLAKHATLAHKPPPARTFTCGTPKSSWCKAGCMYSIFFTKYPSHIPRICTCMDLQGTVSSKWFPISKLLVSRYCSKPHCAVDCGFSG